MAGKPLEQLQQAVIDAVAELEEAVVNKQTEDGTFFSAGSNLKEKQVADTAFNSALTTLANAQADMTAALMERVLPK